MISENSLPAPEAWLRIARNELGYEEVAGPGSNPEIVKYWAAVAHGAPRADDVAWCSAFVNWVMQEAGFRGTRRANARSWVEWGEKVSPRPGAIVILERGGRNSALGHVGFCVEVLTKQVVLLGGNQNNRVSYQTYGFGRVITSVWPTANDRLDRTQASHASGGSGPAGPEPRSPDTSAAHRPSTRRST